MLSTQYRLRVTAICKDIGSGGEVSLEDMIVVNGENIRLFSIMMLAIVWVFILNLPTKDE